MEFNDVISNRFSVRLFSSKQVKEEDLKTILEMNNYAPSAKNLQPQHIYVLKSKESLEKLDHYTHVRHNAPIVFMFSYNKDEDWKNPLEEGIHSGVEDVSIVATYMMLKATELGLDTLWCNMFRNKEIKYAFHIPSHEELVLIMPLGYKEKEIKPSIMHYEHKNIDEIVEVL